MVNTNQHIKLEIKPNTNDRFGSNLGVHADTIEQKLKARVNIPKIKNNKRRKLKIKQKRKTTYPKSK